jgi:MFS family permease
MHTATAGTTVQRSFRDVWLVSAGHGLTHWYTATFYILLPLIGKELGLSYTEIGLIMTIQHLAGAISNIPGGILVDTVGRKGYLMAASLFWVGFPYALMSLTHSFWMLLVCVTLVGIGNNIWHPAAIPFLAHRYPERKGLVLSFHGMGGNCGEAIAPFVIGALLAVYSWRTVVVINVVPGIVMAVVILVMMGALTLSRHGGAVNAAVGKTGSRSEYMRGFAGLLHNKPLMLVSVSAAFRTLTQSGLLTFLPVYLAYELGYSPFAGHLSDKMGRKRVVVSSMILTGVTIAGMALAGRTVWFIVFIALVGFFLYAMRPVLQAWAVECTPKELAGAGVGLQFGITAIGASLGPALAGVVSDASDLYTGFYFLAGTIVAANVLMYFMPTEQAAPQPA